MYTINSSPSKHDLKREASWHCLRWPGSSECAHQAMQASCERQAARSMLAVHLSQAAAAELTHIPWQSPILWWQELINDVVKRVYGRPQAM